MSHEKDKTIADQQKYILSLERDVKNLRRFIETYIDKKVAKEEADGIRL